MKRAILIYSAALSLLVPAGALAGQRGHGQGPKPEHAQGPKGGAPHGNDHANAQGHKNRPHGEHARGNAGATSVQRKLQHNTNLAGKVQSRLPAGTDLNAAASGFRNLGQFVAAVNVSNEAGIGFNDLKTRMVDRRMSLGQAVHDLKPNTDASIVKRAEKEADDLIRSTEKAKPRSERKHGER